MTRVKGEGIVKLSNTYTDMSTKVSGLHSEGAIQISMPPLLNINDTMHPTIRDNRITITSI